MVFDSNSQYYHYFLFGIKKAPENCLQYFTPAGGIGQVKSFNWKDNPMLIDPTIAAPTRQLANQNHLACIRPQSVIHF